MWAIDLYLDSDQGYRWRLWGADGRQACASAESFRARANAERLATRFGETARDLRYEVFNAEPGRYGWRAIDVEGRTVACSAAMFCTDEEALEAADRVRRCAGVAAGV
jgi:uncharacterized protein YegP (UPF0339 family)